MIRGMYIVASSAITESKRMDVIANNIANVNTTGYKKDTLISESFPEILISKIGPSSMDKDLFGNSGTSGVDSEANNGIYSATTKSGFFQIKTALGVSNSQNIKFKTSEDGYLVTPNGDNILGQNGNIFVGNETVTVDNLGRIFAGGNEVDRLKVVNPLNAIGNFSYGIHVDGIKTNFQQGQLMPTENPLDFAIQGSGFFQIETPNGIRYARNGEFTLNQEGYLVTKEGYKVLGENGHIQLSGKNITVSENGEILSNEEFVDKLQLIDFKDQSRLFKEGDGLMNIRDEELNDNAIEFSGMVNQGFVEGSNVNSVKEMVEMITVLRSYEASQRLIKSHDELLSKAVNEIGRV